MDAKLAKGLTREGFRRDLKGADNVSDQMLAIIAPYIDQLRSKGKLGKEQVKTLLLRMEQFKSDPHHTLFLNRFHRKGLSSSSPQFEGAIAGGYFSPANTSLFGFEEKARWFSLFYDRYSRRELESRTLSLPIFIREHAISRYLERADTAYANATEALWPGFLIIPAMELIDPPAIARPFMLPVPRGAFLGVWVVNKWTPQFIERFHFDGKSSQGSPMPTEQDDVALMSFVNTFVPDELMSIEQMALKSAILGLIEDQKEMLLFALLSKVMLVGDEPDVMSLDGVLQGDLDVTSEKFSKLVAGRTWTAGVRAPQDGRFVDYFIAQGMLERQSMTALQ